MSEGETPNGIDGNSTHGLCWGEWIRRRALRMGYRTAKELASAGGFGVTSAEQAIASPVPKTRLQRRASQGLMAALKVDAGVLFEGWARMSPEEGVPLRTNPDDNLRQEIHAAIDLLSGEALRVLHFASRGLLQGAQGTGQAA
ncbi:MAG: hypothetical protein ACM359_00390 [Bacillota bacterium]